jgi:hypothetical protein
MDCLDGWHQGAEQPARSEGDCPGASAIHVACMNCLQLVAMPQEEVKCSVDYAAAPMDNFWAQGSESRTLGSADWPRGGSLTLALHFAKGRQDE